MARPKKDSVRLNLALSPEVKENLIQMREEVGADSLTEVIRRSLGLYRFAIKARGRHGRLAMVDEDGEVTFLEFF